MTDRAAFPVQRLTTCSSAIDGSYRHTPPSRTARYRHQVLFGPSNSQVIYLCVFVLIACFAIAGSCLVPCLWRENGCVNRRRRRLHES